MLRHSHVLAIGIICAFLLSFIACSPRSSDVSASRTSTRDRSNNTTIPVTPLTACFAVNRDNANIIGRQYMKDDIVYLEWTNSGVELCFTGTGIKAMIGSAEANPNNYPAISVQIDDREPERITVNNSCLLTLANNLEPGSHTMRLIKVTEATNSPLLLSSVTILSDGGDVPPSLLPPPERPLRRIEFIGDSITCGFGNLGNSSSARFLTEEQDGLQTYAAFTASALNAEAHYICVSGKGIVKNVNGDTYDLLPTLFTFVSPSFRKPWDASLWQPDVVVINAGTNDVSAHADRQEFLIGAVAFLEQIRRSYPKAEILWCYGMMNREMSDTIAAAVQQFNAIDGHAYYLQLNGMLIGEGGAVGHPNVKAHRSRSEILTSKIKDVTGWSEQ